ncbi:helix-turn-helix transcriptional regulator [Actinoplanes sp. NPDC049118]|uniref:response regulator transcription factor n=1 Tax=Actinoplanes sp. NPDC049118 TaxID=3155769 RepID=UPI0033EC8FEF
MGAHVRSGPPPFTPREAEVLELLRQGLTYHEMASRLGLSTKTVEKHVGAIMRKTGASNPTAAGGHRPGQRLARRLTHGAGWGFSPIPPTARTGLDWQRPATGGIVRTNSMWRRTCGRPPRWTKRH